MTTLTEVLPATLSSKSNAVHFTPSADQDGAGLLVIDTARTRSEFLLVSGPVTGGLHVHLAKVGGGSDPEGAAYDVFVGRAGAFDSCDCKGFTFGRGRPCKHISSVRALLDNAWL